MKIGYTEGLVKQLQGISCGGHYAASCSDCPEGHGASWCTCKLHHKHCDCIWENDECVRKDAKQKQSNLEEWPEYIEKVMAHAQAIFFDPTLGTKIQLEVQEGFLYNPSTTWTSGSLSEAKAATNDADLKDVDVTAWFTQRSENNWIGVATLGRLCDSFAVSINENLLGTWFGSYIAQAQLLAHETGHNMGMSHDSQGIMGANGIGSVWTSSNVYDFNHAFAAKFWGYGCLEDISRPCTKDTCENGGTCTESENGGFICSCPSGITGKRCENGGCKGVNDCCTSANKCREMDGDCDSDSDCEAGLVCGINNCPKKYGDEWNDSDDCCSKLNLKTEATCQSIRPQVSCDERGSHKALTCSDCIKGIESFWRIFLNGPFISTFVCNKIFSFAFL